MRKDLYSFDGLISKQTFDDVGMAHDEFRTRVFARSMYLTAREAVSLHRWVSCFVPCHAGCGMIHPTLWLTYAMLIYAGVAGVALTVCFPNCAHTFPQTKTAPI